VTTIDEIRARWAKATPGPWRFYRQYLGTDPGPDVVLDTKPAADLVGARSNRLAIAAAPPAPVTCRCGANPPCSDDGIDDFLDANLDDEPAPVTYRAGTVPGRIEPGMWVRVAGVDGEHCVRSANSLIVVVDTVDCDGRPRFLSREAMDARGVTLARDWTEPEADR
jgi:hypothetical protein